ncbi:MAG: sulfate permease [Boseongicola sp.]|nr:sulfate permease [Boseongicola sp.]
MPGAMSRYLPILEWGRSYDRATAGGDLFAAVIVTIMLIPQSLAYALLAGLPPETGLYASMAPIVLYSIFGSSRALAVGPVAVVSLMTAAAVGVASEAAGVSPVLAALTLAFLSGAMLVAFGLLRLGFIANFLSHPVIAGFISASGILIAVSQLKHILGVSASGHTLVEILSSLLGNLGQVNLFSLGLGVGATVFLFWVRSGLKPLLRRLGLGPRLADLLAKAGPVLAIAVTTWVVWAYDLTERGVSVVGAVPQSLPPLTMPSMDMELVSMLFVPALLISIIGFVESISVARTLAAMRRQSVDPDQELIGLGAANVGAAFTGGFPVTGGFSRSVVNFDAGAQTPAAGAFTAVGLAVAALFLTPLVFFLPKATLAATIIVAVVSLIDLRILQNTWAYSKRDFAAVAATMILTLLVGVEVGVTTGVVLSVLLFLYDTSRPHVAEVGLVPGTQHFRNILRHRVETDPEVLTLRIDQSLYFANASFLEAYILDRIAQDEGIRHIILMFSAVNDVDYSAQHTLVDLSARLADLGITLHLSEVKGPVMDRLERGHLIEHMSGQVFLSQYDAFSALRSGRETAA